MPFIPHTEADVRLMLQAIGVSSIEDLFEEIPTGLKDIGLDQVPPGLTEMEVLRLMQ